MNHGIAYSGWMLAALLVSAWFWLRAGKRDPALPLIYIGGLLGAFLGAKLVYLLAEGWMDLAQADWLLRWATGKTILGGLLFGYAGVELTKKALRYPAVTGDRFALVVPLGLAAGRLGCLSHGCCLGRACPPSWYSLRDALGQDRWPTVPLELGFHLAAFAAILVGHFRNLFPGQRFHLYLVAYGLFRFVTEFQRETRPLAGPITGYHVAALALALLGILRYRQRSLALSAASVPAQGPAPSPPPSH